MTTDAAIADAINQADGYTELGMWAQACGALEELPVELHHHPAVLSRRLDALIGMECWNKALVLGATLLEIMPEDASLWFRLACVLAECGHADSAKLAVVRCIEIDDRWQQRAADEPALEGIW